VNFATVRDGSRVHFKTHTFMKAKEIGVISTAVYPLTCSWTLQEMHGRQPR
jgi:hypothetical protein